MTLDDLAEDLALMVNAAPDRGADSVVGAADGALVVHCHLRASMLTKPAAVRLRKHGWTFDGGKWQVTIEPF